MVGTSRYIPRRPPNMGPEAVCGCTPPRLIWPSLIRLPPDDIGWTGWGRPDLDAEPIVCGLCGQRFRWATHGGN